MSKALCNDCEHRIGCENARKGGSCDKGQREKVRTDFFKLKEEISKWRRQ